MDFLNRFNYFRQLVNNRNEIMNSEYRFSNNSYTENNIENNKNILSDLPVFRYRKIDKIKCKSCPICLEDYKEGDFIPYFHCEHYIHYNCFKQCFNHKGEKKFSCPVCRQELMTQEFVNISKDRRKEFIKRTLAL